MKIAVISACLSMIFLILCAVFVHHPSILLTCIWLAVLFIGITALFLGIDLNKLRKK